MSLPVGIGLAGLGRWGRNYLKTLLALPECRLVAVADSDPTARAAVTNSAGVAVCESLEQLLADAAIGAVVIATPDRTHYRLAAAALGAGRDVLVEKPMTLSASEAETLVGQAEDNSRVLAVGHTAVYATDIESLRNRLDAVPRTAGRRVRAERTSSGPSAAHSPFAIRHSSILYDLCPHDIALAILLFGNPVAARARSNGKSVEYEVRFKNDELLNGHAEWRPPPYVRRFEVTGGGTPAEPANLASAESTPPIAIRHSPLGRQCLDFIECCRTRQQPLSNGRLGLVVLRCLAGLDSSCADSGAWVQLSPKLQAPNDECRTPDVGPRPSELGVRT